MKCFRLMVARTAIGSAVLLTGMHLVASAQTGPVDDNPIEYSMGPYSDVGPHITWPMAVFPPIMRVSLDGTIVKCPSLGWFWALASPGKGCLKGAIAPDKLQKLRLSLSKNKDLRHSRFIPPSDKNGALISMGGGIFYVRYKSGADKTVLGTSVIPAKGPLADPAEEVEKYWPERSDAFELPVNWYDEKRLKQVLFELVYEWEQSKSR